MPDDATGKKRAFEHSRTSDAQQQRLPDFIRRRFEHPQQWATTSPFEYQAGARPASQSWEPVPHPYAGSYATMEEAGFVTPNQMLPNPYATSYDSAPSYGQEQTAYVESLPGSFSSVPQAAATMSDNRVQPDPGGRKRRSRKESDLSGIVPQKAHLDAELLHDKSYTGKGGMERMKREEPRMADLYREGQNLKNSGSPEQKRLLQELRVQQGAPAEQLTDIRGMQPTGAHLEAEHLHTMFYNWEGGVQRMKQENSNMADLYRQYHALKDRGSPEQKAALQGLRKQRAARNARGELAARMQTVPEQMGPEEEARILQQSYDMYIAIYQEKGEEGLRDMQQTFPGTYEAALYYAQQMREAGA